MSVVRLRTPTLGLLGLLAVGLVAMKLISGDLSVTQAAVRVGIVSTVLVVLERVGLPFARALVGAGARKRP